MLRVTPLLPCLLLLVACPVEDKDTVDTGRSVDTGVDDSGDTDKETGETGTDELGAPPLGVILDVVPGTLSLAEGGTVEIVMEAKEGAELAGWARDTAAYSFSVEGGEPIPVLASFESVSASFTFTVPAGLADAPGRLLGTLARDGEALSTVPLWLADNTDAALTALAGHNWNAYDGTPQESSSASSAWVASTGNSTGGRYDLAFVIDGAELVARACPSDGGSCLEERTTVTKGREQFHIGRAIHMQQDSFASGHSLVVVDPTGASAPAVYAYTLDAEKGTLDSPGTSAVAFQALFGVVLGLNNTKGEPTQPNAALLSETDGLFGVVEAGGEMWTVDKVGEATVKEVVAGTSFVGMATTSDLSGGENSGTSWWWAARWSERAQTISLNITLPNKGAGAFSRVRDVTLSGVDFPVDALTASGEDLDGDGHPELFVEVWGTGGEFAIWMVPDATDKAASAPARELSTPGSAAVSLPVPSAIIKLRKSTLQGSQARILGHQFHPAEWEYNASNAPGGLWVSTAEWLGTELMDGDKTAVEPTRVSMAGRSPLRNKTSCDLTVDRGICLYGKCFCPTGTLPQSGRVLGEGSGGEIGDPIVAGDDVFYGPAADGESVVVSRPLSRVGGTHYGCLQVWHAQAEVEGPTSGCFSLGIGGGSVVFTDSSTINVRGASSVGSVSGGNLGGGLLRLVTTAGAPEASTGEIRQELQFEQGGTVVAASLPDDTTVGGSSVPQLLGVQVSTGGATLAWRDGEGQAWMGVLDVDALMAGAKELPFLEGPLAVGTPVPMDKTGVASPWARHFVSVRQPEETPAYFTGDPLLRMSDFTVEGGNLEMHGESAFYMVEGSGSACAVQTVVLPARPSLEEAVADMAVVSTGSDSTCADLRLPVTAVAGVAWSPELLLLQTPSLELSMDDPDADGVIGWTSTYYALSAPPTAESTYDMAWWGKVSASDVDGDGLSDFVAIDASGPRIFLSDGRGGFDETEVEAHTATNFAILLTGNKGDDLCDPDGAVPFVAGSSWAHAEPG